MLLASGGLATELGSSGNELVKHFMDKSTAFSELLELKVPDPPRGSRRAGTSLAPEAGLSPWARDYIVSQQIKVRVAIWYRAGCAIGKFGTVKRNSAR
jgi:hypothetical protein